MLLSIKIFFYPALYYARQLAKKLSRGCKKTENSFNFCDTAMNKPLVD